MNKRATERKMEVLQAIFEVGQELSASIDLNELMVKILEEAKRICAVEASSLLLVDSEGKELSFKIALGEKGEGIKNISLPLKEGIAGWVARHGETLVVNDVSTDPRFSDRFDKQTGFRTRSILCVPILWEGKVLGVIEIINKIGGGEFSKSDEVYLAAFAQQASIAIHNARLIDELRNFFANAIEILVEAIESIDPLSNGHLLRVARLSTGIGRQMNLGEEEYKNLYYASLIHDIGRLKGGEFAHHHSLLGAEMVGPITLLKGTAEIIKCHHERSNGSGYPQGLKEEGIPLLARILSLAEAYDEGIIEKIGDKEFRERFTSDFLESVEASFGLYVANAFRQVVKENILESIYG